MSKPRGPKSYSEAVRGREVPDPCEVPMYRLLSDPPDAPPRRLSISPPADPWPSLGAELNPLLEAPYHHEFQFHLSPYVTQPPSPEDVEYEGALGSRSEPQMNAGFNRCVGSPTSRPAGVLMKAGPCENKENLNIATARSEGRPNANNVGVANCAQSTTGQKTEENAEVARGSHLKAQIPTRIDSPNRFACLSDEDGVSQLLSEEPSRVEKRKSNTNLKENQKKCQTEDEQSNLTRGRARRSLGFATSPSNKEVSLGQGQNVSNSLKRRKEENSIGSGRSSDGASESGLYRSNKMGSGNGPTSLESGLDRSKKNGSGNESSSSSSSESESGLDTSTLGPLKFLKSVVKEYCSVS